MEDTTCLHWWIEISVIAQKYIHNRLKKELGEDDNDENKDDDGYFLLGFLCASTIHSLYIILITALCSGRCHCYFEDEEVEAQRYEQACLRTSAGKCEDRFRPQMGDH